MLIEPLTEKYRPPTLERLIGLPHIKEGVGNFLHRPYATAFLFHGASGMGKNAVVSIMAKALNSKPLHLIGEACNYDNLREVLNNVSYVAPTPLDALDPNRPHPKFHFVVVDEVDSAKQTALRQLFPYLDSMKRTNNAIFVFTTNNIKNLEDRFISRCVTLEFKMYGSSEELKKFLADVWRVESIRGEEPDWKYVVSERKQNVRACLQYIEAELLIRGRNDPVVEQAG